jgi:hypothetical protein
MEETINKYVKQAQSVLKENRTGSYTVPAKGLYPHQWNWDSGFIAIGYSHYDTKLAMDELEHLFNAQWANGMLPQIVFDKRRLGNYFPEPDFWKTGLSPNSPDSALTSGITMPPIHAYSALKIFENAVDKEKVMSFIQWIYPKLLSFHRYLYRERDPNSDGLIYIRHPWESGMDNSPSWDIIMKRTDLEGMKLPEYTRKDTLTGVSPDMRPTVEYYDYFVFLIELFKKAKYDDKEITRDCPFLVCGPLFNAILCASNESLIKISDILHQPYKEIEEWYTMTSGSIQDKLYDEEHGIFDAYDINGRTLLRLETASGFMPLFGGAATRAQAARIYKYLDSKSFCALHQGNCFTIPSYDTQKKGFKRENYWRGPVWININWMLYQGLKRYGFTQKADSLAHDILELPIRFGFYEYYDSIDGRGYGSGNFAWTAALFIDTAYETYIKTGRGGLKNMIKKILFRDLVLNDSGEPVEVPDTNISQKMLGAIKELKANYYTSNGTIDYDSLKTSDKYSTYKDLTANLRDFDLSALREEKEKLAFWINLYNTIVVDGIISCGVRNSIKEITGFFTKIKYIIGGLRFSPDDIEHGILRCNKKKSRPPWLQFGPMNPRKRFSLEHLDPRIHFALVCGSRSCAPIKYYTPEGIYDELEMATVNFVNSSEVMVIPEENRLLISQIFKWYQDDLGGITSVLHFIEKYILDDDKKKFLMESRGNLKIEYLFYDWNLNK